MEEHLYVDEQFQLYFLHNIVPLCGQKRERLYKIFLNVCQILLHQSQYKEYSGLNSQQIMPYLNYNSNVPREIFVSTHNMIVSAEAQYSKIFQTDFATPTIQDLTKNRLFILAMFQFMAQQYSLAAPNLQYLLDVFIGQEDQPHFKKIQNLLYQCEKNVFSLDKI